MLQTTLETHAEGKLLRIARLGQGPPLVLLHGYPDNLQIWCALAPCLADRYTVIAFDWPGLGYSDAWPGGTTPTHQANRLLTLLDTWELKRVTLVGLDMGGQPALAFAGLYPARIERLVVMNSLVYGDEATSWEIHLLRKFRWNRLLLRHFPAIIFRRAERTFLPPGVRLSPALRADLWDSFRRPHVRKFIVRMCAGYQGTLPRLPELYARITCPTLVLWAEQDKHFPLVQAERLHRALPDSKLSIVPNAEHWMAWYAAEQIADQIG